MADFLYLIFPDNLVLPKGAPVTYGSGDFNEDWVVEELDAPGEIAFGFANFVPPARENVCSLPLNSKINLTVRGENVSGVHMGEGIVILDRDVEIISKRFVIFLRCFFQFILLP